MKSFRVIQGNNKDLNSFENEVSQAIEDGYEFAGELIVKTIRGSKDEVLLFQPMSIEDHLEFENEDLDYDDDDENIGLQS